MTIKELKRTIKTYKTWELKELREIISSDELTKQSLIASELARRSGKSYMDQTLSPKVPIRERIKLST